MLDFQSFCYYSYNGLNGYEKRTLAELAFKFNCSIATVRVAKDKFKKNLSASNDFKTSITTLACSFKYGLEESTTCIM